jgi:Zn-dependent protease
MEYSMPGASLPPQSADDQAFRAELDASMATGRGAKNGLLFFVLSLVIFAATGLFSWKPTEIVMLILVLLFHELGHFLAMKVLRYTNVKIFFIPFLGAAASGHDSSPNANRQALIALAGPLPGLIIGMILAIMFALTANSMYYQIAIMTIWINAFNLLPLYPLDGGYFFESTIFSRHPIVEVIFRVGTIALLGIIAFTTQSWGLFIICFFMLITIPFEYTISRTAYRLRISGVPLPLNRAGFDMIRARLGSRMRSFTNPKASMILLHRVWIKANLKPPTIFATIGLILLYGFGLATGVVGGANAVYAKGKIVQQSER